jgi:predicted heme/steroid binding protein
MSRKFTLEELKDFNGEKRKEIFISVQGKIYDVTDAKDFYGPGDK